MRIRSLDLLAFGPFQGKRLRFANDGGIEVVFGPNEAGKSTTRRAVLGLLFGIPERSKDGHSVDEVRVGATLIDTHGQSLDLVRRKGRKNTLLTPSGEPFDSEVLARWLGGIDANAYEQTYGLDHVGLRKGGAALKVGNGDLGESLFSAATGLTGLHAVLVALRAEADALFVPRGTARPLNEAHRSYTEAKKLASQLATHPDEWLKVEKQIEQARALLETLRRERAALAEERARAQSIAAAARSLDANRARVAELDGSLALARAELEGLSPADDLLSRSQTIAELQERLGSHRKAQLDRPRIAAELDAIEERARKAKRAAPANVESALPLAPSVRKLVTDAASLRARARVVQTREAETAEASKRAAADCTSDVGDDESNDLRDALELSRSEGKLEARLDEARAAAARDRAAVATRIASLDVPAKTLDELLAMTVPSSDVASTHARAAASHVERARGASDRRRRLEEEHAEAERAVAALRAEGDVPTEESLEKARSERDALWDAIRDGTNAPSGRAAGRFERSMTDSDELADRLRREAARVTRLAEAEASLAATDRKLAIARDEERALAEEAAASARAWSVLSPRSPEETIAWLARYESACVAARRAIESEHAVAPLESAARTARQALVAALVREGEAPAADAPLARLEQAAKRLLAARDEAHASRTVAAGALRVAEREHAQAVRDHAALERDRATWETEWSGVTRALGLRDAASPEEAEAALEAAALLARIDEEADKVRRRLAGIDRDAKRFTSDVLEVCEACASDLSPRAPEEACAKLARRVARSSAERAKRETLEEQARRLDAQAREARAAFDQSSNALESPEPAASAELRAADLEARLVEVDDRIQQTSRHLGSVETGAKEMPKSPAVEQAAEAQRQLARVRDLAERFARARLAAAAVSRLLDKYRRENQGPVLTRASSLFATLTLGAFEGLEVGFGESDEPVIVAVKDGRRLETTSLSDGTLDQLYLALRVASLERLTHARGPLPLLLDDVLVHFDDQRAAAALTILSELAKHTQVILFTHHTRIVEIARRAISDRDASPTAGIHDLGA